MVDGALVGQSPEVLAVPLRSTEQQWQDVLGVGSSSFYASPWLIGTWLPEERTWIEPYDIVFRVCTEANEDTARLSDQTELLVERLQEHLTEGGLPWRHIASLRVEVASLQDKERTLFRDAGGPDGNLRAWYHYWAWGHQRERRADDQRGHLGVEIAPARLAVIRAHLAERPGSRGHSLPANMAWRSLIGDQSVLGPITMSGPFSGPVTVTEWRHGVVYSRDVSATPVHRPFEVVDTGRRRVGASSGEALAGWRQWTECPGCGVHHGRGGADRRTLVVDCDLWRELYQCEQCGTLFEEQTDLNLRCIFTPCPVTRTWAEAAYPEAFSGAPTPVQRQRHRVGTVVAFPFQLG